MTGLRNTAEKEKPMKALEHPVNFRSLGGIPTQNGTWVAHNRLLRAGELVALSTEEKQILTQDYALSQIADFRSDSEVEKEPDDIFPGTQYHHLDILKNMMSANTGKDELIKVRSPEIVEGYMQEAYAIFITDECAREQYRKFIEILLNMETGSCLFHCYAGKDRTGMGAAIILTLLGVSREEIIKDYLLTNSSREKANELLFAQVRAQGGDENAIECMKVTMTVRESFMSKAFSTAQDLYGSFEGYLRDALFVTDAEIRQLKSLYLSDSGNLSG
jgi:protein-tyrosine phosphatase